MTARNSSVRYGSVAMTFHWVIAALVTLNIVLGIYFVQVLDSHDPMRRAVVGMHESIGITVLVLSVLRLGWRQMNPIPPLPSDFSPGKRFFARATHYTLYTLMILVPFMGWQLASIPPRPMMLFGVIPWPKLFYLASLSAEAKKAAVGIIAPGHIILAFLLLASAVGHICAALFYHRMVRKDQVLKRMLPGTDGGA